MIPNQLFKEKEQIKRKGRAGQRQRQNRPKSKPVSLTVIFNGEQNRVKGNEQRHPKGQVT